MLPANVFGFCCGATPRSTLGRYRSGRSAGPSSISLVRVGPGQTTVTPTPSTPRARRSAASVSDRDSTACLAALYGPFSATVVSAAMDAVLTMCPDPWATRRGTNAEIPWSTPQKSTAMIHSHSTRSNSQAGRFLPTVPALLQTTSTRPNSLTVRSASALTSSAEVTSVLTAITRPGEPASRPAESASEPSSMSDITTFRPTFANCSHSANPMPLAPPVTTAT